MRREIIENSEFVSPLSRSAVIIRSAFWGSKSLKLVPPAPPSIYTRTTFWLTEDKEVRLLPEGLQKAKIGFRLSQEQKSVQVPVARYFLRTA